ncbi:MAG: 2-amino-4-hydroxy-6-hydroxymethyldihydropteridine pyrophosphokinase [Candidatus Heimdallarchaeota archaeon LC_2]|nr:MAG: 2-amino-4-hydroxy-6-hydroxymethyldihydropteridine pyrophosphokinase [Candidatus Heimdallarchaeota archaeon LC_2]
MLKLKDLNYKSSEKLFITIGSNINPEDNINLAIAQLEQSFGEIQLSRLYRSQAVFGPQSSEPQDDYINGAILTKSNLSSFSIKFNILRKIETRLGRVRTADKFASRTIDLDIAFYGSIIIDESNIRIPDPEIIKRGYLISPLCDLDPEYYHPEENISLLEIKNKVDVSNLEIFNFN